MIVIDTHRDGKKIHTCGYPQIKSATNTEWIPQWTSMDKINEYFNYPLIHGYGCGFNGICTRGYPYPLLNRVNYIDNFQLPKQKPSIL